MHLFIKIYDFQFLINENENEQLDVFFWSLQLWKSELNAPCRPGDGVVVEAFKSQETRQTRNHVDQIHWLY